MAKFKAIRKRFKSIFRIFKVRSAKPEENRFRANGDKMILESNHDRKANGSADMKLKDAMTQVNSSNADYEVNISDVAISCEVDTTDMKALDLENSAKQCQISHSKDERKRIDLILQEAKDVSLPKSFDSLLDPSVDGILKNDELASGEKNNDKLNLLFTPIGSCFNAEIEDKSNIGHLPRRALSESIPRKNRKEIYPLSGCLTSPARIKGVNLSDVAKNINPSVQTDTSPLAEDTSTQLLTKLKKKSNQNILDLIEPGVKSLSDELKTEYFQTNVQVSEDMNDKNSNNNNNETEEVISEITGKSINGQVQVELISEISDVGDKKDVRKTFSVLDTGKKDFPSSSLWSTFDSWIFKKKNNVDYGSNSSCDNFDFFIRIDEAAEIVKNCFQCEKLTEISGIDPNYWAQVPHENKELEKKSTESEKISKETFLNTPTEGRDQNDNIENSILFVNERDATDANNNQCEIDQSATKPKVESLGNGKEKVYSNKLNFTQFNSSNLAETSYFTINQSQLQQMAEI